MTPATTADSTAATAAAGAEGKTAAAKSAGGGGGGEEEEEMELDTVLSEMAAFHKREKATEAKAEETTWAHLGGADVRTPQ